MSHDARLEGLTAAEAQEVESEWKQLGAINIRRTPEPGGTFTLTCTFPGSPFATENAAQVLAPVPAVSSEPPSTINKSTNFADIADEYRQSFDSCQARPERSAAIDGTCALIKQGRARYEALGTRLGIPWMFIGIIHSLESSCNFKLHLHNGDPLTQRTVRVPAGRPITGQPPFTWEQSAEDALRMKGFVGLADWSIASMLFRWESYNGMGYRTRGLPSPYLWSFSNLYTKGRFVADHQFDPNAVSGQAGAGRLLKELQAA